MRLRLDAERCVPSLCAAGFRNASFSCASVANWYGFNLEDREVEPAVPSRGEWHYSKFKVKADRRREPEPAAPGGAGRAMEMLRRSSVFAAEVFDRSPTDKELVSQAKALCRDYIHSRLNRAGIGWSKPEHGLAASGGSLGEVSSVLLWLGGELEYLRPNVYRNVARQLNITVASESVVSDAFLAVAADIFSTGVTWGKVVSLYAVAGGLAVDCVRHGHPAMVHTIVDCMGEFVRKSLASWLKRRGGWVDVTKCVVNTDPSFRSHWLVSATLTFGHYLKAIVLYLLRDK